MSISLTSFNNKFLKAGILTFLAIIVVIIISVVMTQKSDQQQNRPQPYTKLPNAVGNLDGQQVITPKSQRQKPTEQAEKIKQEIIKGKIGENKGVLIIFQSDTYNIEYVPTPDFFLVTLTTDQLDQSKESAQSWFKNFGLTDNDLCNLPVRFAIGSESTNLKQQFDPFPAGCSHK